MNHILAPAAHRAIRPATAARPAQAPYPRLAALRDILATWEERERFRWKLARMARDNPHLIDDIGLTGRQVEAELAKPFWRR